MKLTTLLILSALLISSCASQSDIKVYRIAFPWGLERAQDKEVKPFSESGGYYCVDPDAFKLLLNLYTQSQKP